MKSKLKTIIPVLLVVLGGAYKFVLAKPKVVKPRVAGEVYVLPKDFLVNLSGGRFAKLDVGLVLKEGHTAAPATKEATPPPDGFGTLPQEAVVRAIVTDALTGVKPHQLIARKGRDTLKKEIARTINRSTDVAVDDVLLTDITVQ